MIIKFTESDIQKVWLKANIVANYNPNIWRKDGCGAWIKRTEYGNRNSVYGWEIHHINPNGSDELANLMPLQWENNIATSDSRNLICKRKS